MVADFEVNSESLPQRDIMTTDFGYSSKDSQSVREEVHTVVQSMVPASIVDGDPKPTTENVECVKIDHGPINLDVFSNIGVKDKASTTTKQIRPETTGDIGKKRSCRPVNLKTITNTRDIANFLGFYGPTKA